MLGVTAALEGVAGVIRLESEGGGEASADLDDAPRGTGDLLEAETGAEVTLGRRAASYIKHYSTTKTPPK